MSFKLLLKTLFICSFFHYVSADPFFINDEIPLNDLSEYREPTIRYLEVNSFEKIHSRLSEQDIYLQQQSFYNDLIMQEERGHIGYHASSHEFRIFQDVIRWVFEEILELEFKKDFYFFRIPGDPNLRNHPDSRDFLSDHLIINDNLPEQRDQLISVNFTLFSNYNLKYENTPVFFEKARSFKPPNFEDKIALLFNLVGMNTDKVSELFEVGKMIHHPDAGTMFQIFDMSYQMPSRFHPYDLLNQFSYACIKKGVPLGTQYPLSLLYEGTSSSLFLDQYRIVVNTENVLNPYSALYIRRYDLNEPAVIKAYEKKMRMIIKSIPFDPINAQLYKKKLLQDWKVN